MAAVVDLTNVQSTQIRAIRFENFYFPLTFRIESNRLPRRLQSDQIQRREGVLQQETYENARRIQVSGKVYTGQVMQSGTPLPVDDLLDRINGAVLTGQDGQLCIRANRYYNARVANNNRDYEEGTNGNVADASYEFIASDPFEYDSTLSTATLANVGTTALTVDLENTGNRSTPLKIVTTVDTTNRARSLRINFYENADNQNQITSVMIIDSLGQRTNDSDLYWRNDDEITIDSANLLLTHKRGTTVSSVIELARTSTLWTTTPIKTLPILLPVGTSKISVELTESGDTGNVDVAMSWRNRWI